MAMDLEQGRLGLRAHAAVSSVARWVQGIFGHQDFTPEETLFEAPDVDPRLRPRAPMSNADIDVHLLGELGKLGMKRGKLITDRSHPELMQVWREMSARAGLKRPPQLILAESKAVNALTVSPEEVVVTTGLFKLLDLREVAAVLGHELAHENSDHKRPRMIAMAALGGGGALLGHYAGQRLPARRFFENSMLFRGLYELVTLSIGAFIGSIAANQVAVRPTELEADKKGSMISGDPQGLINALSKLQGAHTNRSFMDRLAHVQSGYPTTESRIGNLQKMVVEMQNSLPATNILQPAAQVAVASQPGHAVTNIAIDTRLEAPVAAPQLALN